VFLSPTENVRSQQLEDENIVEDAE